MTASSAASVMTVGSICTTLTLSKSVPKRPDRWVLLLVYLLWVGLLVAIAKIPALWCQESYLFAAFLVLCIWLPWWTSRNWSTVVADLPATFATLATGVVLVAMLDGSWRWEAWVNDPKVSPKVWDEWVRTPGIPQELLEPEPRLSWRTDGFGFVISLAVALAVPRLWGFLRRMFSRWMPSGERTAVRQNSTSEAPRPPC